ncbi:MAG TPA: TAT-variant-translocated molybdopterin oxidoreductase [Phycisphaerae bacterium]|nr:TAT-variant-translocated molybdopterin oxidoreductase [Phycisphaerae bacterium]
MPSMNGKSSKQGPQYWRSLNELADKPSFREFVEREFPNRASEWFGGSRRAFLKIMGASMALAGLASCRRWPAEDLAPYAHRPVGRMDGVPVHYATAYEVGGFGVGVIAVSVDGRPIKVDGNPQHPLSKGASDTYLQASVLNVYDPDRSRTPVSREGGNRTEKSWEQFAVAVKGLDKTGAGMVILTEASRSPSVAAMRKQFSQAQWFEYEPVSYDNQRAGMMSVAGRPLVAVPQLDKANVIVSIDSDFLSGDPLSIKYNRDFAAGRQLKDGVTKDKTMNRLFVVESGFTITGSMADHRRSAKPSEIPGVLAAIAAKLGAGSGPSLSRELAEFVDAVAAAINPSVPGDEGKAVVVAGHHLPPEVHAAVAVINSLLRAPVSYYDQPEDPRGEKGWTPHSEQIKAFAQAAAGASTVLILGANPVLTAPVDLNITDAIKKAKTSIHAGFFEDETATACTWHVPLAHYLEAWGDVRSFDGTVSIAQPLIEPIFGAKSVIELLALLAGKEQAGLDIVRETAKNDYLKGRYSEWNWKQSLFNGIVAESARSPQKVGRLNASALGKLEGAKGGDIELVAFAGPAYDGRYINNGWLQELPDPMTRVTWDNPLLLSPATAEKLGVDTDDVVTVSANGASIEATVYVMPGQADGAARLALGYGRNGIGSIADGVGSNAYALFKTTDAGFTTVTLAKTGKVNNLACVQDHHIVDPVGKNRLAKLVPELVVEGTFQEYLANPSVGARKVLSLSMWNEHNYDNEPGKPYLHKWGMAIDLTTCTGCSACVVACQSENNIPIVGKEQVYRGREMHWIRMDRYFKHDPANPQAVHQPILCMHCENAPCESVCPVAATTHSLEGLNMMTYNRCIGTRYCSNNCPYKVRRFNFFDYNSGTRENLYTPNLIRADINELHKMSKNPQVTVRSRGVMEKCTYCVQRIENARIELRAENRGDADNVRIPDGRVVTACQQACPTDAIVFGDLNDKNSRVSKLHELAQTYGLLDPELNTKPRTQYLAKVRNPIEYKEGAKSGLDYELYHDESIEKSGSPTFANPAQGQVE